MKSARSVIIPMRGLESLHFRKLYIKNIEWFEIKIIHSIFLLYNKKESYIYYLNHEDEFCRPNYIPKQFKPEFIEEQGGVCAICGCKPEWNGKSLVFVLDHIDGDASNNKRDNLRCICHNCDSQLDTFKSKNKNSTRRNYWKEKIIREYSK